MLTIYVSKETEPFHGIEGLTRIIDNLEGLKDLKLKMDLQNVLYRYFADSARHFKKIEHCLRSGEAELLVIRDGNNPNLRDLNEASEDFEGAMKAFAEWKAEERRKVEKMLHKIMCKRGAVLYAGVVTLFLAADALRTYRSKTDWVLAALPTLIRIAFALGVAGAAAVSRRHAYRQWKEHANLMASWETSADHETQVLDWMSSLTFTFHRMSLTETLQKTQDILSTMNRFLQQLQTKGLIFDQADWQSP